VMMYDLVVLFPAVVVLLAGASSRRVRLALVALAFLGWSSLLRSGAFGALPWPLDALGATWAAVPLLVLWFEQRRALVGPADEAVRDDARQPLPRPVTIPS
jgi:hypothetical protein